MPRRERMKRTAKLIKIAVDRGSAVELLCNAIDEAVGEDEKSSRII